MLNPVRMYRFKSRWIAMAVRTFDDAGYRIVKQKALPKGDIKRILLIRLDDIGDVILATPAIRNLKELFPSARIDMLVKSSTKDILLNNPCINRTWVFDPFWMRSTKPSGLIHLVGLIQQLRKEKYDLAVELRGNPFNIAFAFLSNSRQRVGYGAQGLGFLLTSVIPYDMNPKHEIERNLDVLRGLGLSMSSKNPEVFISKAAEQFANRFLEANQVGQDDLVISIHPGAPWFPRRWPQERFALLANALITRYNSKIILIGSGNETKLCAGILDLVAGDYRHHVLIAAGATDLLGAAALIKRSRLFIGNDSGPMHIAHAVNTDCVALFGPQTPVLFGPGGNIARAIYSKAACSPCIQKANKGCSRGLSCCEGLLNITPEDVLRVIEQTFSRRLG
jgi:heptosyltransferase II